MKDIILWLFNQISNFITVSMTWKIYGNLSLTHFILGFILLVFLLRFLFSHFLPSVQLGVDLENSFKNVENAMERKNYYNYTHTTRFNEKIGNSLETTSSTIVNRVNRHTGEVKELHRSRNRTVTYYTEV